MTLYKLHLMSELIQTGWGNGHMYRLTRDIYIYTQQIWNCFFFYTIVFFYAFNVIDTAHMTYDKDCSSFGRKTIHDVRVSYNSLNKKILIQCLI